jgi:sugar-phosphatase
VVLEGLIFIARELPPIRGKLRSGALLVEPSRVCRITVLKCQVVLFDCDGVLVDSDASVILAWSRWARSLGLEPHVVNGLVHGRRSTETVTLLIPKARRVEELARIDRYEVEDSASVRAIAGAYALLESIPHHRWAVVTSGRRELASARLCAAQLPIPAVLVTAEDVARGKPDPEGDRIAAERLGHATNDAVVIEDAPIGVQAARAAGAGAILGVGKRVADAGADLVVPDLRSLRWTGDGLEVLASTNESPAISAG